jgi:hypothetical protein
MIDFEKATAFMDTHARLLDRRRFDYLFGDGDASGPSSALTGHRNPDGGYGWALEPDLRGPASQPAGALHAFEVMAEIGPALDPSATALCDWLGSVSLPDGGLPFALRGAAGPGTSPWWGKADPSRSSLHITAAVCGMAHRVAAHDPAVARHPWLASATAYCIDAIASLEEPTFAIAFKYVLELLDRLHGEHPDAARELERLGRYIPPSGAMPVPGGAEGEAIRALDFSPEPGRPLRALFAPDVIAAELDRLAGGQLDDGGWDVDHAVGSPAAALEWRGYATVEALAVLRANGRLAA